LIFFFVFSSRRRHTRSYGDWSSDVCSSDLALRGAAVILRRRFSDVIRRQLDLFVEDNRGLIEDCAAAERAYNRAPRDEAEERYRSEERRVGKECGCRWSAGR